MKPDHKKNIVSADPWVSLKSYTNARIALGAAGTSIPNEEVLKFKLAHAHTKDAIDFELDIQLLEEQLSTSNLPVMKVSSRVRSRDEYLKRPDLGRRLSEASAQELANFQTKLDCVFVLADGLSANAVNKQGVSTIHQVVNLLGKDQQCGIVLASQARVALGDEIGSLLNATFVIMLIGERPGLSSPESMGIYTTYAPTMGLTDERRNCISNIHEIGLSTTQAAQLVHYLYQQSCLKQTSGIAIKVDLSDNKIAD